MVAKQRLAPLTLKDSNDRYETITSHTHTRQTTSCPVRGPNSPTLPSMNTAPMLSRYPIEILLIAFSFVEIAEYGEKEHASVHQNTSTIAWGALPAILVCRAARTRRLTYVSVT